MLGQIQSESPVTMIQLSFERHREARSFKNGGSWTSLHRHQVQWNPIVVCFCFFHWSMVLLFAYINDRSFGSKSNLDRLECCSPLKRYGPCERKLWCEFSKSNSLFFSECPFALLVMVHLPPLLWVWTGHFKEEVCLLKVGGVINQSFTGLAVPLMTRYVKCFSERQKDGTETPKMWGFQVAQLLSSVRCHLQAGHSPASSGWQPRRNRNRLEQIGTDWNSGLVSQGIELAERQRRTSFEDFWLVRHER